MWTAPREPTEPFRARAPRAWPRALGVPWCLRPRSVQASSIRVDTLLLARPSASYRDAASVDGASVRVRVTRPPDASLAVLHRAGETVLTLGIGAAVIALAVALLPPGGACGVAAVMVTLIAGALQGALPGCAGAMRAIYGSVAKRTATLLTLMPPQRTGREACV